MYQKRWSQFIWSLNFLCLLFSANSAHAVGALAIDNNQGDQYGWAVDYPSVSEAEIRVLKECGKGCQVVKTFSNTCAAYVADQSAGSSIWGWGEADSLAEAKTTANRYCTARGGRQCLARAWGCDSKKSPKKKPSKLPDSTVTKQGGVYNKRVYFDDTRRCSAWCPEAQAQAKGVCGDQRLDSEILNCQCNETQKPYYADVQLTCKAPKQPACTNKPQITTEGYTRNETFYFNNFERCSRWCPQAKGKADAICQSEGKVDASDSNCHCNETQKPYWAKIAFSCRVKTTPCKGVSQTFSVVDPLDDWVATVKDAAGNYYANSSKTESSAEGQALSACRQKKGKGCTIINTTFKGKVAK